VVVLREVEASATHAGGADDLVRLDPDHPGFRDEAYLGRRNTIARLALEYRESEPVPQVPYTEEEQGVWQAVWTHLERGHQDKACAEYQAGAGIMDLDRKRIPQLSQVNLVLQRTTGFRMLPVAGLVTDRTFLGYLARGIFLSTQYIRHHSRPLYTPEPDVVHELIGHAVTFVHAEFALINRLFGAAAARSNAKDLARVARVYWYTMEFGAAREAGSIKAYGAGLLSSGGELERLEEGSRIRAFDLDEMAATPYDPTSYQPHYFVAESFTAACADLESWLAGV
jgi:phenylalanine-4-hydroxylase